MTPRILFYVQHLLGIGHVVRALRIARALKADQFAVKLVMGGMPVDGLDLSDLELIQLPPVQSGTDGFTDLVDETGKGVSEEFRDQRRNQLLACYQDFKPDILLIEAYPFGRRQMRFELIPLLNHVCQSTPKPIVATSVRDILQENRKSKRLDETVDILNRYFDLVLVHGDERFNRLEDTFPPAKSIVQDVAYTGIVSGPAPQPATDQFDVIVSAGGGAVGEALLRTSMTAQPMTSLADARWLFVTGPNLPQRVFEDLKRNARPNIQVERFRSDLTALFFTAKISISQCGYNTIADILQARCAAVVVPFAAGGETEQTRRAIALRDKGRLAVVTEDSFTATSLAAAFENALTLKRDDETSAMRLDGASVTASILRTFRAKETGTS